MRHLYIPLLLMGLTAHEAGNFGEALQLFTKAAEQGDAEAQFYLGLMHYNGDGLPQDP